MRKLLAVLPLLTPVQAFAQDFHCRNVDAEIRCTETSCDVETDKASFTPMELRRTGNTLSICAYSACWEGPIRMRRTYGGVTFLSAEAKITSPGEPTRASLSVMVDREGGAQVRWLGFSQVMRCGAGAV